MAKILIEDGQISLFQDVIESNLNVQTRDKKIKALLSDVEVAINQYSNSCKLIAKLKVGGTVIYLKDKVMYFNKEGEHESDYDSFPVFPNAHILIANEEHTSNEFQRRALDKLDPGEYITRKGDNNIYILGDNGITYIDESGQVWNVNMELNMDSPYVINKREKMLSKGQQVKVIYEGKEKIGKVWSIYNDGNTVNVLFDDDMSIQPWYKSYVKAC